MIDGAIALAIYCVVVCQLILRARLMAMSATLVALVVWLIGLACWRFSEV